MLQQRFTAGMMKRDISRPLNTNHDNLFDSFYNISMQNKPVLEQIDQFLNKTDEYQNSLQLHDSRHARPHEFNQLERDTWELIFALYMDRELADQNKATTDACASSEKQLLSQLYENDACLREIQIVIDWLEGRTKRQMKSSADKIECLFSDMLIWDNTRHLQNVSADNSQRMKNLINQLHPDAPLTSGKSVDQKDMLDQKKYLGYLFLCLRSGDIQRAQNLCIKRGDHWRAAMLEGWRPFHCSQLCGDSPSPDEGYEDDTSTPPVCEGNPSRAMHKSIAWWNAEDPRLIPAERAVYAVLAGNLEALLGCQKELDQRRVGSACNWDDVTWAHLRCHVEARIHAHLRNTAASVSVTGETASDVNEVLPVPDSTYLLANATTEVLLAKVDSFLGWSPRSCLDALVEQWRDFGDGADLPDISSRAAPAQFSAADDCGASSVSLGLSLADTSTRLHALAGDRLGTSKLHLLKSFFYSLRQAVLLRDYENLSEVIIAMLPIVLRLALGNRPSPVHTLNGNLSQEEKDVMAQFESGDTNFKQLLRFLVHFLAVLRDLEPTLSIKAYVSALEAYLTVLIADEDGDLVIHYASRLPRQKQRVAWMALYLSGLSTAGHEKHPQLLAQVANAGIDQLRTARAIIRILRRNERIFQSGNEGTGGVEDNESCLFSRPTGSGLGDAVGQALSCLDWLQCSVKQRGELLVLANSLLRMFLQLNDVPAMQMVISRLPDDILDQPGAEFQSAVREFRCVQVYLAAQESFAEWFKFFHANPKPAPAARKRRGAKQAKSLSDKITGEDRDRHYQAELQRWRQQMAEYVDDAAGKLTQLVTLERTGWLEDEEAEEAVSPVEDDSLERQVLLAEEELDALVALGFPRKLSDEPDPTGIAGLGESATHRREQMRYLRQQVTVQTLQLLLQMYQQADMHDRCVGLADLVATEKHAIYKLLTGDELCKFLQALRKSAKRLQETTGNALGYQN